MEGTFALEQSDYRSAARNLNDRGWARVERAFNNVALYLAFHGQI